MYSLLDRCRYTLNLTDSATIAKGEAAPTATLSVSQRESQLDLCQLVAVVSRRNRRR